MENLVFLQVNEIIGVKMLQMECKVLQHHQAQTVDLHIVMIVPSNEPPRSVPFPQRCKASM